MSPGKATLKLNIDDDKDNTGHVPYQGVPTPADPGCNPLQFPAPSQNQEPQEKPRRRRTLSRNFSTSERAPILRSSHQTIYTAGRPPWYNNLGQQVEPLVIGICGGSASGKTTVTNKIISAKKSGGGGIFFRWGNFYFYNEGVWVKS